MRDEAKKRAEKEALVPKLEFDHSPKSIISSIGNSYQSREILILLIRT
jgi:hypothetical protein